MVDAAMIDSPLPDGDEGLRPAGPQEDFADSLTYAKG